MTTELDITTDGRLGIIALNRPAAINALSLGMIEAITETLSRWRDDAATGAVLFEGRGAKGFCAGGDVRVVRALVVEGKPELADAYFAAEYRMNGMIAGYAKPLIAVSHGIAMGGGIGIAGHCRYRLTQPGARFAMPEAAIGFFPDVGVNAILAKAPLNRALLFEMTGTSVGAADALDLGLADAVVDPARLAELRMDLAVAAGSSHPDSAIVRLIEAESIEAGDASFCGLADLLPADAPASPADFLERVAAVPALAEMSALLGSRSPSALTAIFHAQLAARQLPDVAAVLDLDLRLAGVMARAPDFAEGVRAVLVDKDQRPSWRPARLAEVDPAAILRAVKTP
ncbi:MAG: enoyl-CoA hydratase/isomerase family protein [Devosia nanyangense]|uniref:3-hydroxyisobutyryl-CoA hydrolase n=1 Tax=Devosia nanyangense TaxID=1228055 RepID=A0A933KZG8_9HYPH|nr:enoyl-CoA hydratase/isomerase family protein [Devosia nanyangense]